MKNEMLPGHINVIKAANIPSILPTAGYGLRAHSEVGRIGITAIQVAGMPGVRIHTAVGREG